MTTFSIVSILAARIQGNRKILRFLRGKDRSGFEHDADP